MRSGRSVSTRKMTTGPPDGAAGTRCAGSVAARSATAIRPVRRMTPVGRGRSLRSLPPLGGPVHGGGYLRIRSGARSAEQQVEQLSSTELGVARNVVADGGERADLQRRMH